MPLGGSKNLQEVSTSLNNVSQRTANQKFKKVGEHWAQLPILL
jgi:hypothetical protein